MAEIFCDRKMGQKDLTAKNSKKHKETKAPMIGNGHESDRLAKWEPREAGAAGEGESNQ